MLTGAFSKLNQASATTYQKALTVAKILVDKWLYVYSIRTYIHSHKGHSFKNKVLLPLYSLYSIKPSTSMPYNPHGNSQGEKFDFILHKLLQILLKAQKANWPANIPSLMFAYNGVMHDIAGFQPYTLIFGHKATTVCNAWLGLAKYNDEYPTQQELVYQ